MHKILLYLLSALLVVQFSPVFISAQTHATPPQQSERFEDSKNRPIEIETKLAKFEKFVTRFTVTIVNQNKFNVSLPNPVSIQHRLYKLDNDGITLRQMSNLDWNYVMQIGNATSTHDTKVYDQLEIGQYRYVFKMSSTKSASETVGDVQDLYFTVTPNKVHTGWTTPMRNEPAMPSNMLPSNKCPKSQSLTNNVPRILSIGPLIPSAGDRSKVTLTGTWVYSDRDHETEAPVRFAEVEVWYIDCYGKHQLVSTTSTDNLGKFKASYDKVDEAMIWQVKVIFNNTFARVEDNSGLAFADSRYYPDLSNGGKLEQHEVPFNSNIEAASWIFHDIIKTYNFLTAYQRPNVKAILVYNPTGPDPRYLRTGNRKILVNQRYSESNNVVPHELGHLYMDDAYLQNYPAADCFSAGRNHIMNGTTEPGCAWTEGWAHFISLAVNGSSTFTYEEGETYDVEHTSTYEDRGDSVEGRVAGALWDLYDRANDGLDTRNYIFDQIYKTMYDKKPMNFVDFWNNWLLLSYDRDAKYSLHQNNIMYDNFVPLLPAVPQLMEGIPDKVFLVRGTGNLTTIETSSYKQYTDTWIELYADSGLKKRLAYDDDSAGNGYSRISNIQLDSGKDYYLKVTNYNEGKPVYAKVSSKTVESNLNNIVISASSPGYVNGDRSRVFQVIGQSGYVKLETSQFGVKSDTYLEVYSDEELRYRIVYDDDSAGDFYSKVVLDLPKDKRYYVKVRNYIDGDPVYAKLTVTPMQNAEL